MLHAKVSDFGVSKPFVSLESPAVTPLQGLHACSLLHTGGCGTARYMAPEVTGAHASYYEYSESCDVYSYGVTIWELMYNERFPTAPLEGPLRAPPPHCEGIGALVTACHHYHPDQRPAMHVCADNLADLLHKLPRETAQAVSGAAWQASRDAFMDGGASASCPVSMAESSYVANGRTSGSLGTAKLGAAAPEDVYGGGTRSMLARWLRGVRAIRAGSSAASQAASLNSQRSQIVDHPNDELPAGVHER